MKRFAAILIAILFTAPTEAQTTWEYRSTDDAVWTEVAEDTATVYLVHGAGDYATGENTKCQETGEALGIDWVAALNAADDDQRAPSGPAPQGWPDYIMRGDSLDYASGDLHGVRMNGCWDNEWTFVAETHSEVGSSGTVTFNNSPGTLIVIAHVVASRDDLPDTDPVIVTHDPDVGPSDSASEFEIEDNAGVRFEAGATVSAEGETPATFALEQNYPNPFNPSTTIEFSLDKAQHVLLSVYDLLGQEVQVLMDSAQPAGRYSVPFDAANLASGTYMYVIRTEEQVAVKTMSLLK